MFVLCGFATFVLPCSFHSEKHSKRAYSICGAIPKFCNCLKLGNWLQNRQDPDCETGCVLALTAAKALAPRRSLVGLSSVSCWSAIGLLLAFCHPQLVMIGHSLVTDAECMSVQSLFSKKHRLLIVDNDFERWGGHALCCQSKSHLANTHCIETFHKKV